MSRKSKKTKKKVDLATAEPSAMASDKVDIATAEPSKPSKTEPSMSKKTKKKVEPRKANSYRDYSAVLIQSQAIDPIGTWHELMAHKRSVDMPPEKEEAQQVKTLLDLACDNASDFASLMLKYNLDPSKLNEREKFHARMKQNREDKKLREYWEEHDSAYKSNLQKLKQLLNNHIIKRRLYRAEKLRADLERISFLSGKPVPQDAGPKAVPQDAGPKAEEADKKAAVVEIAEKKMVKNDPRGSQLSPAEEEEEEEEEDIVFDLVPIEPTAVASGAYATMIVPVTYTQQGKMVVGKYGDDSSPVTVPLSVAPPAQTVPQSVAPPSSKALHEE